MSAPHPTVRALSIALTTLLLIWALAACQGTQRGALHGDDRGAEDNFWSAVHEKKADARHARKARVTGGTLERDELVGFLDRGPAHLLGQVPVFPVLDGETLLGYRIEAFFPDAPVFHHIDMQAGDIITAVNGMRIERPEHLFELYESLRTAPRLQIDVIRDSTMRTLTWEIVDAAPALGQGDDADADATSQAAPDSSPGS